MVDCWIKAAKTNKNIKLITNLNRIKFVQRNNKDDKNYLIAKRLPGSFLQGWVHPFVLWSWSRWHLVPFWPSWCTSLQGSYGSRWRSCFRLSHSWWGNEHTQPSFCTGILSSLLWSCFQCENKPFAQQPIPSLIQTIFLLIDGSCRFSKNKFKISFY